MDGCVGELCHHHLRPPPCPLICRRMAFSDFETHFDKVEICNLTPDALEEDAPHKWEVAVHQGSWVRGSTAGGCRNFLGSWSSRRSLVIPECPAQWGDTVDQGQDPRGSLNRGVRQ